MAEDSDNSDNWPFSLTIFSEKMVSVFKSIPKREYGIGFDEARVYAEAFALRTPTLIDKPYDESIVLYQHICALEHAEVLYLSFVKFSEEPGITESYKRSYYTHASFYAELFFLLWFSFFEKMSHLINARLGWPLDSEPPCIKGVGYCSFALVCERLNAVKDRDELLDYFVKIRDSEIYRHIAQIRHDLTHRFLTAFSFAGSIAYGPLVERHSDKKGFTVTERDGPKPADDDRDRVYKPEEVRDLVNDATGLLVEIKRKVFEYAGRFPQKNNKNGVVTLRLGPDAGDGTA